MSIHNFYNTAAVAVLLLCFATGISDIVVAPTSREVQLGGSTYFNCSTSVTSKEIHWFHYPVSSTERSFVYGFGIFYSPYLGRFTMDKNATTGGYNLIITSVMTADAGKYECQDDAGSGMKKSAQLIFLDVGLVCQSNVNTKRVIGPNSCDIEPDQLILTCMVRYHGNEAPILHWRLNDSVVSITDGVTSQINDNRVTYNLTMTTDQLLDGSFYECRTTRSTSKISCNSGSVKVVGSTHEMSNGESFNCSSYKTAIACICLLLLLPLLIGVIVLYLKPKCNWIPRLTGNLCSCLPCCNESIKKSDDTESQQQTLMLTGQPAEASMKPGTSVTDEKLTKAAEDKEHLLRDLSDESIGGLKTKIKTLEKEVFNLRQTIAEDKRTISDLRQKEESNKERIDVLQSENKQLKARVEENDQLILQGQGKVKELEQHLYPKESIDYLDKPELAHTIQLSENSKGRAMSGMTILDKDLFVVTERSQEIEVYDSKTFQQHQQHWKVEELIDPLDIASSEVKCCLYIIDRRSTGNKLQVMCLRPKGEVINQWSIDGVNGRLSTNGSNVVICLSDKQLIKEYSPDGELISAVSLSPAVGIKNPLHAIKVTSTCFVVSHGDVEDELHRVCVVDSDGKIKKECTKWEKSKILSRSAMKVPICLVEDKERSIIVADRDNNRILLLSSLLKYQRKLIDIEQSIPKVSPVRLCFDDTQSRLFIAVNRWSSSKKEWDVCRILIFNIKYTNIK